MTTPADSWTELRYTSRQVLPAADGIADELDAVTWWDVDAVRCCPLAEEVVGSGVVAVFDRALIASYPQPHTEDEADPAFSPRAPRAATARSRWGSCRP